MQNKRTMWFIAFSAIVFLGAAVVTLRAAEQAVLDAPGGGAARHDAMVAANVQSPPGVASVAIVAPSVGAAAGAKAAPRAGVAAAANASPPAGAPPAKQHPPASAPEESSTISDDPTTAPDPSQSADNNVSFPTDI